MRRRALLGVCLVALAAVPAASSALRPIRRDFGEQSVPRLRHGKVQIPRHHGDRRVRVVVTLAAPPLARAFHNGLFSAGRYGRLDVRSRASQAYLRHLRTVQARAIAQLRRAIPSAAVGRRYQVVLNGFVVTLPVTKLPALTRSRVATHVWPSLRYTLKLNRSPAIIGADVFHQTTGANGEGIKIGVVDDGVDNTNPFLSGNGFTAPAGFPIGDARFTNNKVIVARAFPGPGSETEPGGRLPLDRRASFHGTHVAGIAAGDAGTCAPPGVDHPPTCGLSGVAPRAYVGNYRVFNVPTPIGHVAESPEIAAAFEQTVKDGMDVMNFSGGGPESEPATDVLIQAVNNVAAAGVVPVISAGNDGEDFGPGSAGAPGTAPDSIAVAAVSNMHVYAPALSAFDAAGREAMHIPINTGASSTPAAWITNDQTLVDVGAIQGRSGAPVSRWLCAPGADPNANATDLPPRSLDGMVALVSRGYCTFASKAQRVKDAGGIGMILVDNRPGEPNGIPLNLSIPAGMIADLDGAQLRTLMGSTGRVRIRVGKTYEEIATGRGGIVTVFSGRAPTSFGHRLKPDVAAPGGQILSSTLPEFAGGSPFAVFDGTSMSAPHVTGAAALLVQRHPAWTPQQVKSALMSTAGAAYADTARTVEAPVTAEGAGLVNLPRADNPLIFTSPSSLSFGDLNVNRGAQSRALMIQVADAGAGAGDWTVSLQPQAQTRGVTIALPSLASVAPGASASLAVEARAAADAEAGDQMGFVILTRSGVTRRIPYYFAVTRPALETVQAKTLATFEAGDTIRGESRVSQYRFPAWPFGPPPNYSDGPPMNEAGAEKLYTTVLSQQRVNFGVAVWEQSRNSIIDPWVLGSPDENDVQGFAGTPVNVNGLMFDYRVNVEAAGASFPVAKRYYVSVDSGSDPFTRQSLPGRFVIKSWVDDLKPPVARLLTTRVASGRPTLAAKIVDAKAGVDPLSVYIAYNNVLLGAALYDFASGLAVFPIPTNAPAITKAKTAGTLVASDFQETKNVNTIGKDIMPNTVFKPVTLRVVKGPSLTWLLPSAGACQRGKTTQLVVTAHSTTKVRSVAFFDGKRRLGIDKSGVADLFTLTWKLGKAKKGKHSLKAVARDARGRTLSVQRSVRVCK